MTRPRKLDAGMIAILVLLPLLWFAPQALGNKTLLPAENLYTSKPWSDYAAELGVAAPHNPLISDLILENYPWKLFLREALHDQELPLWSPRIFAGAPFLAAGQHSAYYPLSILFYILPLWRAYGVFTWLQLGGAAAGMYIFARVLGQRPLAGALAGIAFAFSGFFIVSVNFTMMIAAAAWLPLILAAIEMIVRTAGGPEGAWPAPEGTETSVHSHKRVSPVPYVVAGAALMAIQVLAGHIEITYYVLMTIAFYAAWRLTGLWWRLRECKVSRPSATAALTRAGAWTAAVVVLGLGLSAVQLIPLYELVSQSFRQGAASLQQVRDWAWPAKQLITFILPDAFGNPTHHSYFDIWQQSWLPVTQNALGQPLQPITGGAIDWGAKNYVEGANYLGLPTLLCAAIAVLGAASRLKQTHSLARGDNATYYVLGFAGLALLSLLFAFGTPLYALLFYAVPGYSQLHSAFRWVFPYTLCMAALAGFGLDLLLSWSRPAPALRRGVTLLGVGAAAGGLLALLSVLASLVQPGPFVRLGERLLAASELAQQRGFANGAMAWSYEAGGLVRGALIALAAGIIVLGLVRDRTPRPGENGRGRPDHDVWAAGLLALLVADLWWFGHGFNPATARKLLDFTPPIVTWLQGQVEQNQPWRLTTFDAPGEKLLNANAAMIYGLEDIRGYDSIIARTYVAYMQRVQEQGELLYNRIAPLYGPGEGKYTETLDSPLLDVLGVKYVLTTQQLPNAGYRLAYPTDRQPREGELRAYEHQGALPRAFIVPQAIAAADQPTALDMLHKVDPREVVVVQGLAPADVPPPASPQLREARISSYGLRQVLIDVNISDRGWLVFTDSYFPDWKAYIRPFGAQGEGVDAAGESVEQQAPLYQADGIMRAVYLDRAGQWTVRFVYTPRSFLLGAYTSFLAGIVLLILAGAWAWQRFYRGERSDVGTAAKNSVVQIVLSLLNRGIDFAFTMLRLRVLGPVGEGSYVNAINFYLVFEILTRFGLGTLVTRDVARERGQARRYLANVVALRLGLWLVSLPLLFITAFAYRIGGKMSLEEGQAIAIFAGALLFANIADAITSVFNAFEKMEYPAGLATAITVAKVAFGALVLLPPLNLGFVGLAGVSLVTNVVQMVWLYIVLVQKVLPRPEGTAPGTESPAAPRRPILTRFDWGLQRQMLTESGPLMLNHLLATVFWRISQFVLRGATNAAALGIFSVGVKFLDGLNVIPSYFTLAIFPLMSRYALAGNIALVKAYRVAVQLLLVVALPLAVFTTFAATPLVRIVGGSAFLPDSATSLAIMIWSIVIGFVNSVTQYVLIAVNRQRFLTKAFVFGVAVTALANLVFVPRFGYLAAALILIPAELSLFIPFAWAIDRYVAKINWLTLAGGPILAALVNLGTVWALQRWIGLPLLVALTAGFLTYVATLLACGTFRSDDFAELRARLPSWLRPGASQHTS